jgi:hypothetical protein
MRKCLPMHSEQHLYAPRSVAQCMHVRSCMHAWMHGQPVSCRCRGTSAAPWLSGLDRAGPIRRAPIWKRLRVLGHDNHRLVAAAFSVQAASGRMWWHTAVDRWWLLAGVAVHDCAPHAEQQPTRNARGLRGSVRPVRHLPCEPSLLECGSHGRKATEALGRPFPGPAGDPARAADRWENAPASSSVELMRTSVHVACSSRTRRRMMPTVDLIHADGDGAPLGAGQRSTGDFKAWTSTASRPSL